MDKKPRKVRNLDSNPCIEESDASQRCLDTHNYDKAMCSAYFQSYKNCRKYWILYCHVVDTKDSEEQLQTYWWLIQHTSHNIMVQRRREGVKPDMPTAAERQHMLAAAGGKPY